ncbi:hypothetical protein [Marinobacterium aestuariivivens]|uniref:Uncharacterized protein n=1 Tax=Marinobacterium aestuariivivens TaxID=1698799 RepID=A0ABW2A4B6_9GAMM
MLAQYLLLWSPQLWPLLTFDPGVLDGPLQSRFGRERVALENFVAGLPAVQRLLAQYR